MPNPFVPRCRWAKIKICPCKNSQSSKIANNKTTLAQRNSQQLRNQPSSTLRHLGYINVDHTHSSQVALDFCPSKTTPSWTSMVNQNLSRSQNNGYAYPAAKDQIKHPTSVQCLSSKDQSKLFHWKTHLLKTNHIARCGMCSKHRDESSHIPIGSISP